MLRLTIVIFENISYLLNIPNLNQGLNYFLS